MARKKSPEKEARTEIGLPDGGFLGGRKTVEIIRNATFPRNEKDKPGISPDKNFSLVPVSAGRINFRRK